MQSHMSKPMWVPTANSYQLSASSFQASGFRFCRCGFTLVELLAVITIITMLAALVMGGASYALRKASMARCYAQMEIIKNALSDYRVDKGLYPRVTERETDRTESVLYKPLVKEPNDAGRKSYIIGADFVQHWPSRNQSGDPIKLVDPWGNYYRYLSPGLHNQSSYDLWSGGPDGGDFETTGSGQHDYALDDINNWASGR